MKIENFKVEDLYDPKTNIKMDAIFKQSMDEFMYENGVYKWRNQKEGRWF